MTIAAVYPEYRARLVDGLNICQSVASSRCVNDYQPPKTRSQTKYEALVLDAASRSAFNGIVEAIRATEGHRCRLQQLEKAPRCAGKASVARVCFEGEEIINPLENMLAIVDWRTSHNFRQMHTLWAAVGEDKKIPMRFKENQEGVDPLFTTMLGSTKGVYKAPAYDDWATAETITEVIESPFFEALAALEMLRQPGFTAATAMKMNALTSEALSLEECFSRNNNPLACVELTGQKKPAIFEVKTKSASHVAQRLFAQNIALTPVIEWEDHTESTAGNYRPFKLTSNRLNKDLAAASRDHDLNKLTRDFTALSLGVFSTFSEESVGWAVGDQIFKI